MTNDDWRRVLGYGGLIPFVALALVVWLADPLLARMAVSAQLGYGALILTFVGALHWGRGMAGGGSAAAFIWSVLPSLWAWVAMMMPQRPALLMMAVGLALAWGVDQRLYADARAQAWHAGFMRLRAHLTLVATVALLAGAAAPAAGG